MRSKHNREDYVPDFGESEYDSWKRGFAKETDLMRDVLKITKKPEKKYIFDEAGFIIGRKE